MPVARVPRYAGGVDTRLARLNERKVESVKSETKGAFLDQKMPFSTKDTFVEVKRHFCCCCIKDAFVGQKTLLWVKMLHRVENTDDGKTNVQISGRAAHLKLDQLVGRAAAHGPKRCLSSTKDAFVEVKRHFCCCTKDAFLDQKMPFLHKRCFCGSKDTFVQAKRPFSGSTHVRSRVKGWPSQSSLAFACTGLTRLK